MAKSPFSFLNAELLADFTEQAGKLLPGEKSREEFHKSLQIIVQNTLAKLDLVSRDEFEAQKAVLLKTRQKLDHLETELENLAKQLDSGKKS